MSLCRFPRRPTLRPHPYQHLTNPTLAVPPSPNRRGGQGGEVTPRLLPQPPDPILPLTSSLNTGTTMKRLQIPKLIRWAGIVLTLAGMVYFGIDAYSAQTPAAIGQFLTATGALFLILIATESREASATAPADLTRAERANHLDYVYKFWVRDWLEAEIGAEGAIPTGFEALRGDYVLELDGVEQTLGTDESIFAPFDKVGREPSLLILGEPGGGKTIALLMLARHLLVRAGNDL